MMILKRFRVRNFRSVKDSGWIDCDSVTSLVGINEAGKSNLILALWKLNPARNEDDAIIDALHDMPAAEYSSWRDKPEDIEFITGEFEMEDTLSSSIADKCNCDPAAIATVRITRSYDEHYSIGFPNLTVLGSDIKRLAESSKEKANTDDESSVKLRKFCDDILAYVESKATLIETECVTLADIIKDGVPKGKGSAEFNKLKSGISQAVAIFGDSSPSDNKDVQDMIIDNMPKFVYYSNYGNLDAQIYLPHVVKLLKGEAIPGFDNRAKVRTLRVLFDFVNLKPQEVLDLGKDPETLVKQTNGQYAKQEPKPEEIAKATKQKEERTTLLNSASTKLTREFKNWWKQGSYTFRLQADGDFFKIWVSDDKRPEEIELERRSTGLQWFLSFFLIFLVERADAHKGAILLLDEAGLTLHPLAQKDLVGFFENLSTDNQIIHTTHSPFLIDTSNIDRVKVVYSDKDGHTVAADDLRAADDSINEKSIYAVRSALGLTVSDILLQGCQPVIVEGTSDQYYLNAIKLYLISKGKMAPTKELIFMPAGGCTNKAVKAIAGLVSGRNDDLPFIVLDSDKTAKSAKLQLSSELYKGSEDKIISIADVTPLDNSEVEDLIPVELMSRQIDRLFKEIDEEDFTNDFYDKSKPVVSQIESFAKRHFITLDKSWKVQLAKSVKQQLLQRKLEISDDYIGMWISLFNKINRVEV